MKPSDFPVIGVTQGMSGYFAVHYWWNPEGFPEPYNSGFGRYATELEAAQEAQQWALDEDIRLDAAVAKLLAADSMEVTDLQDWIRMENQQAMEVHGNA